MARGVLRCPSLTNIVMFFWSSLNSLSALRSFQVYFWHLVYNVSTERYCDMIG